MMERTKTGWNRAKKINRGRYEQNTSIGWHEEGRVHPVIGWQTRALGSQRPAFCGLGDVSPQGLARRSEPHLRVANQRLVRAGDPALRRRRQNVAAAREQ